MKKFLTVLLALSVVFTYSFSAAGSVFAGEYTATEWAKAVTEQEQKALAEVVQDAKDDIAYKAGYISKVGESNLGADDNGLLVSKEAAEAAIDELVTAVFNKKISDKAIELAKNGTLSDDEVAAVHAEWAAVDTIAEVLAIAFEKTDDYTFATALKKQVAIEKDAALVAIDAVKTAGYSTEEYMKALAGGTYSYIKLDDRKYVKGVSEADKLAAVIKAAKTAVDAKSVVEDADVNAVTINEIRVIVDEFKNNFKKNGIAADTDLAKYFDAYADAEHQYFMTLVERQNALTTKENQMVKDMEAKAQAFEETTTEYLQEIITNTTGKYTEKDKSKAEARLAEFPADLAKLMGSYSARISEIQIDEFYTPAKAYNALERIAAEYAKAFNDKDAAIGDFADFDDAVEVVDGIQTLVAYATDYAETLKTTRVDGSTELKYDADVINTILATTIQQINSGDLETKTEVRNYMDTYADTLARADIALATARVAAYSELAKSGEDAIAPSADYDDDAYASLGRLDAINALRTKAVEDVKAAKTVKEIQNIIAAFTKATDAYLTDAECNIVVTSNVVNVALNEKPVGSANSFAELTDRDVDAYFVGKTGYSIATKDAIKQTIKNELKVAVCGLGELYPTMADTLDAMENAYNKIFATEIAKAKTNDELKAAAKNVTDLIDAIDTPVTQESRDQYAAAVDAYDAYIAMPGTSSSDIKNKDVLTAAGNRLQYLDKAEILAAYAKLSNRDITVADKATIAALNALEVAYEDFWNEESPYVDGIEIINEKYAKAAVQDFINKAGEIPTPVTVADKAKVDAAKAAYAEVVRLAEEAGYTEEYLKAYLDNTYGTGSAVYTNIVKSYLKTTNAEKEISQAIIASVEALKVVKNHSVAGKGYIKINWQVKGDAAAVDGYQIYRSTKANKNFKYMFTTTKMTYKNTKSVKKGTRYFYKVRAFVEIDGVKYYSDWSNKAYRVAK